MQRARELRKNLFLLIFSLMFALVAGELVLRAFYPSVAQDSLFPPGQEFELTPDPSLFPGITGPSRYSVNTLGFRGTNPAPASIKALAMGGSTTECLYLDQNETWPALLEELLHNQQPVWLGNFSKSGLHTGHHLQQLQWMLRQPALENVQLIYCLTGFNDLIHFLGNDSVYLRASEPDLYRFAFTFKGDSDLPWYKRLSLWKALAAISRKTDTTHQQDPTGIRYADWRRYRMQDTAKQLQLPALDKALELYTGRIMQLMQLAETHHIKLVFITQPVCWNNPAIPEDEPWFWLGKKGDFADPATGFYYRTEALAEGMKRFNEVLRNTVSRNHGLLADLAAVVPKNRTVFYDDCHFTEAGARLVAGYLFHYTDSLKLIR